MTLERAAEIIKMHIELGSGYNRNAVRLVLAEVARHHPQSAVDNLIISYNLEQLWHLKPGTKFN